MASVAQPQAAASSSSTSTSSTGEPVLDSLMQQLAPEARQTYWQALARFLRFETSKAEFEESVAAALGDKRALHNAFIYALLRGALVAPGTGGGHLAQLGAMPSLDPAAPQPQHVKHKLSQASASWLSGGCFQRQSMPQAARSFGLPRPISRGMSSTPCRLQSNAPPPTRRSPLTHLASLASCLPGLTGVGPGLLSPCAWQAAWEVRLRLSCARRLTQRPAYSSRLPTASLPTPNPNPNPNAGYPSYPRSARSSHRRARRARWARRQQARRRPQRAAPEPAEEEVR
eukprot:scaffold94111_cov60-Phaeocystis_antarctica.AAC.1